jgi:hypothetical protein
LRRDAADHETAVWKREQALLKILNEIRESVCLLTLISHLTYSRDLSHSDTKTLFDFTYCAEITADAVTAMREYSFTPHRGSGYIVATPQSPGFWDVGGLLRALSSPGG